jgi:hypothetical protein
MAHTAGTAYARNTLNGIIRLNDANLADFEYSNIVQPKSFLGMIPWAPASNGTQHKFTMVTSAAGAAFRAVNTGLNNAASYEKTISLDLKYLDASFHRDVAIVQGAKDRAAYLTKETGRALAAGFSSAEYQLIQGTGVDALGYDGLQQLASLYDGNSVNVAGSGGTRVYMLIAAEDAVCGIAGNDGQFVVDEAVMQKMITDAATGAGYNAYNVNIGGYLGLQVAGKYSIAFAYNIDGTSGKGVTDSILAQLYAKFPSDRAPMVNMILMSMKGLGQLQASRSATSPTGAPAPFPASWDAAGREIPIVVSDAVNDAETTVTTTTTAATTTTT